MAGASTPFVAFSSERREAMRTQIGNANYSYVFVETAIITLMAEMGLRTGYVREPESFKSDLAYQGLLGVDRSEVVHVAFRSTENIRPMHGVRNICHFAWEFEVLKDGGLATDAITSNQVHMLGRMDEVWVGCTFTRDVLKRYGVAPVHIVPAPVLGEHLPERIGRAEVLDALGAVAAIPLRYSGGATRAENADHITAGLAPLAGRSFFDPAVKPGSGRMFLSVLSPGDLRKNLLSIIDGFQLATEDLPDDVLVLKLAVPNKGNFRAFGLYDILSALSHNQMCLDSPRVIVILDYLTDHQMACLFSLADFYLAASHCEGYHLPLLQAMSFGTVPVTTRNTAMLDYIDGDNAIVIEEKRLISPIGRMAGDVAGQLYEVGFASRFDVARAVAAALRMVPDEVARRSEAARQTVLNRYGALPVKRAIAERLAPAPVERAAAK